MFLLNFVVDHALTGQGRKGECFIPIIIGLKRILFDSSVFRANLKNPEDQSGSKFVFFDQSDSKLIFFDQSGSKFEFFFNQSGSKNFFSTNQIPI